MSWFTDAVRAVLAVMCVVYAIAGLVARFRDENAKATVYMVFAIWFLLLWRLP